MNRLDSCFQMAWVGLMSSLALFAIPAAATQRANLNPSAVALSVQGPVAEDKTLAPGLMMLGTEKAFSLLLDVAPRQVGRGVFAAPTPSDLQVRVANSSLPGTRILREADGWVLHVDGRALERPVSLSFDIDVRSASRGIQWRTKYVVNVLQSQTQRVLVPQAGTQIRLSNAILHFEPHGSARPVEAIVRWATLADAPGMLLKVDYSMAGNPSNRTYWLQDLPSVNRGKADKSRPLGSIADALDATTPYAESPENLAYQWKTYKACYINQGEMRLPPSDTGECVRSQSGELNSLVAKSWSKSDWANVVPVLFIHGYTLHAWPNAFPWLGGGEGTFGNFANLVRRLDLPGGPRYAPFEYRWNTDTQFVLQGAELSTAINDIFTATGKKVVVVAHSFGGVLLRTVLENLAANSNNARSHVQAVLTLGSPHSGIMDEAKVVHGVSFPGGQDSLKFEGCTQVSCFVAGEWVKFRQKNRDRLMISEVEGEDAASLHLGRKNLPPIRLVLGIGNEQKQSNGAKSSGWIYGTGDGLISFQGQRLLPSDRDANLRQWTVLPGTQTLVKEQLLGFVDGFRRTKVGAAISNSALTPEDTYARSYSHSEPITGDGDAKHGAEAHIRADALNQCDVPATCQHASWHLLLSILRGKLNDTGLTVCTDPATGANVSCKNSGQDGEFGRDVTANDGSDGASGFVFTKISAEGKVLPPDATVWTCVLDVPTGLMWEVKTDYGGLHDPNKIFTNIGNGGTGDTSEFINQTNTNEYCGYRDWRLPTLIELTSVVDYQKKNSMIDEEWFPHTEYGEYWTSNSDAENPQNRAWLVSFSDGFTVTTSRESPHKARLVRSVR